MKVDTTTIKKVPLDLVQYKYFFEHSYDFTCIANTEGYFEFLNPKFCNFLGYDENELLKNKFVEFVHPDDIKSTLQEIEKLKTGAITINFSNRYRKKDGTYIWLEWTTSPDVMTGKLYAIARDITQKKINENIIKIKTEELAQINNELEQFVYVTTHNLEIPLNKIEELAKEIQKKNYEHFDQVDNEKINLIISASNKMKTYTQKLLFLSRTGKSEISIPINCNLILEQIKNKLADQISENKASLTISILPTITGNPEEIEELFNNLLTYAITVHKKELNPEIKISAEEKGNEFLFTLKTNNLEIENKFEMSIFLILTSININQDHFDSDLLFLICKKIVNAHNGKIWIESKVNEGSIIYFTISKTKT
jgi:PAS domain S-box-containing protein